MHLFGQCWREKETQQSQSGRCNKGYHIDAPSESDKENQDFKQLEEKFGKWTPDKVPKKDQAVGKPLLESAGHTPVASPRNTTTREGFDTP